MQPMKPGLIRATILQLDHNSHVFKELTQFKGSPAAAVFRTVHSVHIKLKNM